MMSRRERCLFFLLMLAIACGGSASPPNGAAGSGGASRDGSAGSSATGGSGGFVPTDASCCSAEDSNRPLPRDASIDDRTASGGSAGRGGTQGQGGAGASFEAGALLGVPCGSDIDCGGGLKCVRPTDDLGPDSGGWPNGVCTLNCTESGDECSGFGGVCLLVANSNGVCTERCVAGDLAPGIVKCHNRHDEVCINEVTALAICFPLCAGDGDCGSRKCNISTGLCVDHPPTIGAPLGSPCMADSECLGGFCIPLGATTAGVCSGPCRLGNTQACGFRDGAIDAGPAMGACLFGPDNAGLGDLGACAQLCDTTSDCNLKYPDWTCIQDPTVKSLFGHGYCALGPGPDL